MNKLPQPKGEAKNYTEEELRYIEKQLLEQHKALGEKFNFDPEGNDPVELVKLYKNRGSGQDLTAGLYVRKNPLITTTLTVTTWIWEKEQSHRLFNFSEGYRILPKSERLVGSYIIRKDGQSNVKFERASTYVPPAAPGPLNQRLLNIVYSDGYHLYQPGLAANKHNIIENSVWLITRFLPDKRCELLEGDVVRFGRIPFKITKLRVDLSVEDEEEDGPGEVLLPTPPSAGKPKEEESPDKQEAAVNGEEDAQLAGVPKLDNAPKVTGGLGGAQPAAKEQDAESDARQCRICLDEEASGQNPFITPCKCIGSVRWIHLDCLREWLKSKKQQQYHNGVHSFYWEELTCELCKQGLNIAQIAKRDRRTIYYLLGIKKVNDRRYMVLESDIECLSKAIHIIDFSVKNVYNVGRRVTNDITVSDISVSRKQSEIELDLDTNQLFLTDCYSKFGTFVKVNGLHKLDKLGEGVPVQVEKKCFFLKLRERYSAAERCWICLCPSRGGKDRDHFCDVSQKFPLEIKKQLMPVQFEIDRLRLQQALKEKKEL